MGAARDVHVERRPVVRGRLNLFALSELPGGFDRMVWQIAEERGPALYGNEWYEQVNPGVITYQDLQVCTLRVVDKEGTRVEGLRVLDATSNRLLPMNNPGCWANRGDLMTRGRHQLHTVTHPYG